MNVLRAENHGARLGGHGRKPQIDGGKWRLLGSGRKAFCALRFKCVFLCFIRRMKGKTKKKKSRFGGIAHRDGR